MRARLLGLLAILILAAGCTENERAKRFGGTAVENLDPGQKLVSVSWKGEQLWLPTRPMRSDEVPETHEYIEKSKYGMVEGKYIIREHAPAPSR